MDIGTTFERVGLQLHQALYVGTRGRIGHRAIGVPSLLLTTTGRRTGQPRTVALIYARDGADYLVVASNHGDETDPAWFHNLRAQPRAEVQVGRERSAALARVVTADDPAYPRLWRLVNENNHGRYDGYQRRTSRRIPLVVLTPDRPL